MISVGIDVSKEKSTVCVLKPYGEIVMKPKDVQHTESELLKLVGELQELQEEIRVVMAVFMEHRVKNEFLTKAVLQV